MDGEEQMVQAANQDTCAEHNCANLAMRTRNVLTTPIFAYAPHCIIGGTEASTVNVGLLR